VLLNFLGACGDNSFHRRLLASCKHFFGVCIIQMQVAGMPAYTDITKAHEIANLARRLQKDLRDAINDAAKYNNRERLFDMPITNVSGSALYVLIKNTVFVSFLTQSNDNKFV